MPNVMPKAAEDASTINPQAYITDTVKMSEDWTLNEFSKTTCYPGARYFYSAKGRLNRCFWGIVNIIGLSFTISLLFGLFIDFSQSPTFTVVTEISEAHGIPFPDVTLCYHYRTTITEMKQAGLDETDLEILYHSLLSTPSSLMFDPDDSTAVITKHINANGTLHTLKAEEVLRLLRKITPTCDQLVKSCSFGFFHFKRNCCSAANHFPDITDAGPCLTLPVVKDFQQEIPGIAGGIRLHLLYPQASQLPKTEFYTFQTDGVALFPHASHAAVYAGQVLIPSGHVAFVSFRRNQMRAMTRLGDECQNIPENFKDSRPICVLQCLRQIINSLCGCGGYNSFFETIDNITVCNPLNAYKCGKLLATATHLPNSMIQCYRQCPKQCLETQFELYTDYSPKRKINENITDTSIVLNIKFEHLSTRFAEEKLSQTWKSFLSNIGGTVGMWLGTCFFGFTHICHHFTMAAINYLTKRQSS